jgi:hypothetical protein
MADSQPVGCAMAMAERDRRVAENEGIFRDVNEVRARGVELSDSDAIFRGTHRGTHAAAFLARLSRMTLVTMRVPRTQWNPPARP